MWPVAESAKLEAPQIAILSLWRDHSCGAVARAARRQAARAGKLAQLLSRRPVTYWCAR